VIVVRHDKVLLGLRTGSHGAGTWSCPGGHIEFGETVEECSSRETFEETGMSVEIIDAHAMGWNEKVWKEDGKHYITVYSLAYADDEEEPEIKEPNKCTEWRWFGADEIKGLKLMEETRMGEVLIDGIYAARILREE